MRGLAADASNLLILEEQILHSELSDNELISRVQRADDESAFEELFNRHRRRVALVATRFFRQPEQIEEIVQEAFAKAFFAIGELSVKNENSFAGWIARIAFNCCYDELRREKRHPAHLFSELSEDESDALTDFLRRDGGGNAAGNEIENAAVARDLASKLLARLSPEDRMVLVLMEVEQMSVAEIGEVTKWSASKVKVRAHRARAALRKVVERFL